MVPLSVAEVTERVGELQVLHQLPKVTAQTVRAVMAGGQSAVKLLLGADSKLDSLPAANLMLTGLTHLAHKIGRRPDVKVDPTLRGSTEREPTRRARLRADKVLNIVEGYETFAPLDLQLPQVGRWLPGYGFAVWVITDHVTPDGDPYPRAQLRDPYQCYPGNWGPDGEPGDMAILYRIPPASLRRIYGDVIPDTSKEKFNNLLTAPGWSNLTGEGILVAEYYDATGFWLLALDGDDSPNPDRSVLLERVVNPPGFDTPRFVVPKRFSFDALQGQYDHLIGLLGMMARLNILTYMAMEDAVNVETNIFGDQNESTYRRGRGAVNTFPFQAKVEKPVTNMPYQIFQQIGFIENQFRVGANYSPQDDGDSPSPSGFNTDRALARLQGGASREVDEYHTVLRFSLQDLDAKRLWWDQARYPTQTKPLIGTRAGEPFAESYRPDRDIASQYRTRRVYGMMAGWDEPQVIVTGLQLLTEGVIDVTTFRENLRGLDSLRLVDERLKGDRAERILYDSLLAMASGQSSPTGQPDPRALLAAIDIKNKPGSFDEVLAKYFSPSEPDLSPEEEEFLGQGEEGPPPGDISTAFARALGGGNQATTTTLSRAQLGGGVQGGVQTVSTRNRR